MADEFLYRYDDVMYAPPLDEYDEPSGHSTLKVELRKYPIVSRTPQGAWIGFGTPWKFVKLNAKKRFACPTLEEAKESFIARKNKQARILRKQLQRAEEAVKVINGSRSLVFP